MGKILNVHSCRISSCCAMLIQNLRLPSRNRNLFTIIILNTLPGQGKIVSEGVWVQGAVLIFFFGRVKKGFHGRG